MNYDQNNVFARILRGEIPCHRICENEGGISFYDVSPQAKIHALVIPKGPYRDAFCFHSKATSKEILDFSHLLTQTLQALDLVGPDGFRLIANSGKNGGQEVPHYHIHILGGESIGPLRK